MKNNENTKYSIWYGQRKRPAAALDRLHNNGRMFDAPDVIGVAKGQQIRRMDNLKRMEYDIVLKRLMECSKSDRKRRGRLQTRNNGERDL